MQRKKRKEIRDGDPLIVTQLVEFIFAQMAKNCFDIYNMTNLSAKADLNTMKRTERGRGKKIEGSKRK